jgi:transposase InsO family protein
MHWHGSELQGRRQPSDLAPLLVAQSVAPSFFLRNRSSDLCHVFVPEGSSRPDDGPLRQRLRELAAERRRFGYRRLGYLLAREGMAPNHKRLLRVYREENCGSVAAVAASAPLGTRAPMVLPDRPNQRWSLDFVSDTLTCSRRFRILCVVDDYPQECLALVADTSLSGVRVARELTRLIGSGYAASRTLWSAITAPRRVAWHYIASPGWPGPSRDGAVSMRNSPVLIRGDGQQP